MQKEVTAESKKMGRRFVLVQQTARKDANNTMPLTMCSYS